jgi:hypothetical protein
MQRGAEGLLGSGDKGVGVDIEPISTFSDLVHARPVPHATLPPPLPPPLFLSSAPPVPPC